jgi:hypothetical protein
MEAWVKNTASAWTRGARPPLCVTGFDPIVPLKRNSALIHHRFGVGSEENPPPKRIELFRNCRFLAQRTRFFFEQSFVN